MTDRNARILMKFKGSSCLSAAWYNREKEELTVQFTDNGRKVKFLKVPLTVAVCLAAVSSPGRYFVTRIKDVYDFRRVS
jgi:hypothetical protein